MNKKDFYLQSDNELINRVFEENKTKVPKNHYSAMDIKVKFVGKKPKGAHLPTIE